MAGSVAGQAPPALNVRSTPIGSRHETSDLTILVAMGAAASLEPHALEVDPGGVAACVVTVRNTGGVVDEFTISVLGPAGEWATVEPPSLSLFPGAEGTATVRLRPPRDASTQSGRIPFGVRVASREDPARSTVEEAVVTVTAYGATTAELVPRTARGRRAARFEIAVDNRGNAERTVGFVPTDPAKALRFRLDPPQVVIPPGNAAFVRLDVRSPSTFMRGKQKTLPFAVSVEPEGDAPVVLDGSFTQDALLPKWLIPAVIGVFVLAVAWFVLLKPTIKDDARDAVLQPTTQSTGQNGTGTNGGGTGTSTNGGTGTSTNGGGSGSGGGSTTGTNGGGGGTSTNGTTGTTGTTGTNGSSTVSGLPNGSLGAPTEGRLAVHCPSDCNAILKPPPKHTISVTDLLLQNPRGDVGTITISIRGVVALVFALDNFRDLDEHFLAPITLAPGDTLSIRVSCQNTGKKACTAGTFYSGFDATGQG
jgi:hypothetical protein